MIDAMCSACCKARLEREQTSIKDEFAHQATLQRAKRQVQDFLGSSRFVPTGSAAYGLLNPEDNDLMCEELSFASLVVRLNRAEIPYEQATYEGVTFDNIKFELFGQVYNVFSLPKGELKRWNQATKALRALVLEGADLTDKRTRVFMFRSILSMLKPV